MKQWIFLSVAILAELIGTSSLKYSNGFTRLAPSAVVVVAYVVSFYFLSLALKTMPVGVAYAVWAGVGVALITLAGRVLFGQALRHCSSRCLGPSRSFAGADPRSADRVSVD